MNLWLMRETKNMSESAFLRTVACFGVKYGG